MFRKAPRAPSPNTPAGSGGAAVTDAAPCQKSVRIHVPLSEILPVRQAVTAEFQKQAALPGFRKGKAPSDLVERQYGREIHDETLHRVTTHAFEQAASAHRLKPVGPFEVGKAEFREQDGLLLEATVEVEPSFPLSGYKGLPLTRAPLEVTPQDVEKALASLQESMAQLVPAKDGGEKQRQLPALDDAFAKDLGVENLAKLREHVEAKLREQQRAAQAQAMEAALCDELLKRHAFEVPPRLVGHQTERLTRDFKARLLLSGMADAQVQEEAGKFADRLRANAERYVRLSFVLDRIAEQEQITVTQNDVVGRLWQLSRRWKKDPAEVRKIFDAEGLWPSVASAIRQEKTLAQLMSAAAIDNGTHT